jgi:nucleoid-associated protein YgaU
MSFFDIYLVDPLGPQLWLPVNPEIVSIQTEKRFETVDFLNLGEVDFPSGEKIQTVEFSSFFPIEYDSSYCQYSDIPGPADAFEQLTAWTKVDTPVRLIIGSTTINMLVLISASKGEHRGGEPSDIYYDLTCRSWREVKIVTSSTSSTSDTSARPDFKTVPAIYVTKAGDTLTSIAKNYFDSLSYYSQIYDLNQTVIGPNPLQQLTAGIELVMPK